MLFSLQLLLLTASEFRLCHGQGNDEDKKYHSVGALEAELASCHAVVVDQIRDGFRTLSRTSVGQGHDLIEHHKEIFHAQNHVDGKKGHDQRERSGS